MNIGKNDKVVLKIMRENGTIDSIDLDEAVILALEDDGMMIYTKFSFVNSIYFVEAFEKIKIELAEKVTA